MASSVSSVTIELARRPIPPAALFSSRDFPERIGSRSFFSLNFQDGPRATSWRGGWCHQVWHHPSQNPAHPPAGVPVVAVSTYLTPLACSPAPPLAYISARYGHRPFTSVSSLSDCQRTAPAVHLCFVVRSRNCSSLQLRFRTSSIRSCYFIRYISFFLFLKIRSVRSNQISIKCPIIADQLPCYGHQQVEPSLCSDEKEGT